MADRTSAYLFHKIFTKLAEKPDERACDLAAWFAKESKNYDFSPEQMELDDSVLAQLGLTPSCNVRRKRK